MRENIYIFSNMQENFKTTTEKMECFQHISIQEEKKIKEKYESKQDNTNTWWNEQYNKSNKKVSSSKTCTHIFA